MTHEREVDDVVEAARQKVQLASAAVETAMDNFEEARKALSAAHLAATPKTDLEEWREAHDAFCFASGVCFTGGSTDCATRSRIAGLKAAVAHLPVSAIEATGVTRLSDEVGRLGEKLERFLAMPEWQRFYMDKVQAEQCLAALRIQASLDGKGQESTARRRGSPEEVPSLSSSGASSGEQHGNS